MTTLTVGAGQQFTTISAAVAAAKTGDTINVQAGTYTNDFPPTINGLTVQGVGGIVHLVATQAPPNGKAIFDVAGNTTLKNLDFSGAAVSSGNGAGVRYESGNLIIQNSSFHNNQDGLLGAADPNGTITINGSEFHANGANDGSTHNMYIGNVATFTLINSYVHDAAGGHEVKSRAANNIIMNNRIFDNAGNTSYSIDLPNGGNATISGNIIEKGSNAPNYTIIAYGEEGASNPGTSVNITGNSFVNDRAGGAFVLSDNARIAITSSSNTLYNIPTNRIDAIGVASTSGYTTVAVRPTLDTSSPVNPNPGGSPVTVTPTPPVDTVPPVLTAAESLSGLTRSTSDALSGTVSDSGSGVARVEIFDVIGGSRTDLGAATIGANGAWSFTAGNLADGSHSFTAAAADNAGNASAAVSAGAALVVDTTPPTVSGTSALFGPTRATNDALSGTVADAGSGVAAIEIYDTVGGTRVDLGAAAILNGSWNFNAQGLANGTHVFSAVATDALGNASANVQLGGSVLVDTIAPTLTAGEAISGATTLTSDTISGTVADGGSGAATIEVYDTMGTTRTDLGSATLGSNGSWSFIAGNLAIGSHGFSAIATDLVGNASGAVSAGAALVVSATPNPPPVVVPPVVVPPVVVPPVVVPPVVVPPVVVPPVVVPPVVTPPTAVAPAPAIQSIVRHANGTVTLSGVASANDKMTLTDTRAGGTATAGSGLADASGHWSITTTAPVNLTTVNSFAATATDPASALTGGTSGKFLLSSAFSDTMTGTAGQADVFAFFAPLGRDTIAGFETTKAAGANHDVIDIAGSGLSSFSQLQPMISGASTAFIRLNSVNTITLTGVSASSLQASDFKFT